MSTQAQAVTFDFEEFSADRTNGCPAAFPGGARTTLTSTKPVASSENSFLSSATINIQVVKVPALNLSTGEHGDLVFDSDQLHLGFNIRQWGDQPPEFGTRSLDLTCDDTSTIQDDNVWFLANLVDGPYGVGFSVQDTDNGVYTDTIRVLAYAGQNATGPLRDQVAVTFTGNDPQFQTASLTLEEGTFQSVLFRAEDAVVLRGDFMDNIAILLQEIPEPGSGMLGGFTIGALAAAAALTRRS